MKNQIKKVLSLVLVAVMCLSTFALCVSAEEECAHANKIQTSTTEATCLGYGYTSYKCADCGADFVEDLVKPLGHDWSEETTTPATCENKAGIKKVCKRCETPDVKPGESTGKSCTWGEPEFKVIEGDLTKVETCTVCGNVKETVIDAGHSHDAEASNMEMVPETLKKPTCTEKGSVDYKCNHEDCGFVVTVEIKETHQLTEHAAKPHTCEEDGNYKYWTCDLCEAYFMMVKPEGEDEAVMTKVDAAKIVDKAAHTLVKGATPKTEEDCTPGIEKKAVYTWTCSVDGCDYTEDKAEENFVHKFVTDEHKSYAATCVKYGFEFKYCTVCGVSESKTIAPLGFLVKDDADNKKDVYKTLAELKAGVADYIVKKNDAPCGGYATYVYKIYAQCGDDNCICKQAVKNADNVLELAVEYGEIKQHPYVEVTPAKAPTCTEKGNKALEECPVCKAAGKTATEYTNPEKNGADIDPLGHDWSEDILYCSVEDKAILQCEVCDVVADAFLTEDELEELEFVKPEGTSHIELVKEYEAPSCTEDGKKITYCYACHQLTAEGDKIEVIPAIGHSIDFEKDEYFVQAGSCKDQTLWIYSCKNEGCSYNVAVPKGYDKTAAGHMAAMEAEAAKPGSTYTVPAGKVLRNATCTVRSLTEYTCLCGVTFTVLGDAEDTGSHVLDKNHTEAPICAIGQNGKSGVYCLTCAAAGKEAWVSYEEVPFVHDKTGEVAARPTCLTKAEYDANPYGWEKFTYCAACEAYELDETIEKPEGFEMALESKAAMTIVNRKAAHNNEDEENGKKVSEKIESTCDAVGVDKFTYCVACGDDPAKIIAEAKKSDKYKWNGKVLQLPKKEHMKGKETAVEADCVNFGYTLTYCAFCSDALIVDFDYENGHSWIIPEDEEDILTENLNDSLGATYDCTKPGYKYYECENCDERNKFDEVAPHHVDADSNKIFDCTDAEEDFDCIHCGKVELESLHDYKSTVNDIKLPTCTEPGWKISICATCGHQEDLNGNEPGNILILAPVGHHSIWFVEPNEEEDIVGGWFYSVYEQVDLDADGELDVDADGEPVMGWVAVPAESLEDALDSVELVEDKCVEPTHTADGKVVYLCAVCEEEVEIVVPQLNGVDIDITADNALVPGAPIVNGGKVQFTVVINANDIDAAGIKADFFYDADVLTFIKEESFVADIFNATIDGQTVVTNSIIGTPADGRITVIADASKTEGGTSVDVNLNDNGIKFVTLTFRVAADAKGSSALSGLVSQLTNAKGEMEVNIDVDSVVAYEKLMDMVAALEAKYAKELAAYREATSLVNSAFNAKLAAENALKLAEDAVKLATDPIAEAEKAVADAQGALDAAETDEQKAEAQTHLDAKQDALDNLKDALNDANEELEAAKTAKANAEEALAIVEALQELAREELDEYFEAIEAIEDEYEWFFELYESEADYIKVEDAYNEALEENVFDIALLGDVNGDGSINIADVVAIRKMQFTNMDGTLADDEYYTVLETEEEDEEGNPVTVKVETNFLVTADLDMDGDVDLADYALINQYLVGNITYEQLVLTSQAAAQ